MLNNILITWFIVIISIFIINIGIRLYKYYMFRYLFSINVSTFIDLNGINLITWITFKNIYTSPLLTWKSKDNLLVIIKALFYILSNDIIYFNRKLCIIISDVNPNNKLLIPIAQPLFINLHNINSVHELFNKIEWNTLAFNNDPSDLNDIVITIKIL